MVSVKGFTPTFLGAPVNFFDPNTPSMRKVGNGKKEKEEIMSFIVATNVVTSQLPERQPKGMLTARAKSPIPT